jgi:hypothetical protein
MRFFFFTKTNWVEPPRLRHQLAQLLENAGHEIIFFQCPIYFWQKASKTTLSGKKISLYQYRQLLHHKLRLHPLLHHLNYYFEKKEIKNVIKRLMTTNEDVIINFNYDYYFLKDIFPKNKILTIINDDFWSRAIGGYELPLIWALKRTCKSSDCVLTVSVPLMDQLKEFCRPKLFFPWSNNQYQYPSNVNNRNQLLFWGYIGDRLDFNRIISLAKSFNSNEKKYEIILVGPHNPREKIIKQIKNIPTIKLKKSTSFVDLDLENTLAIFIPYKANLRSNDMCTIPNKLLQLMSRGLPVIITGMPNFITAPFVFRLSESNQHANKILLNLSLNFESLQPEISSFVTNHSAQIRLKEFIEYVESC